MNAETIRYAIRRRLTIQNAVILALLILAMLVVPCLDSYFGTHVPVMQQSVPTALPTSIKTSASKANFQVTSASDAAPAQSTTKMIVQSSPTITHETDLLGLNKLNHGDRVPNNSKVTFTHTSEHGAPTNLIAFDTTFQPLNPSDQDKVSEIGKGLTLNLSDDKIHANSGGVITMTIVPTFIDSIDLVDLDKGSATINVYNATSAKPIFHLHIDRTDIRTINVPVRVVGTILVIKFHDSVVVLPHFLTTSREFKTLTIPATLPTTLGECANTKADADMFHVAACPGADITK